MKICSTCKTEKPFSEFHKDSRPERITDGYRGSCKLCVNSKNRKWYLDNRDQRLEVCAKWEAENKEKRAEQKKIYYLENKDDYIRRSQERRSKFPERVKMVAKQYYENNKERHRQLVIAWGLRNKDLLKSYAAKRRARYLGAEGSYNDIDIQKIFERQFGMCTGCGDTLVSSGSGIYHVDHVMPLALGGSNWPENLQLLCPACNLSKGAKHPDAWEKIKPLAECRR